MYLYLHSFSDSSPIYVITEGTQYYFILIIFLLFMSTIEVWLIYNGVLVSGIQQSDSAIYVCVYAFSYSFPISFITGY